MLLMVTFGDIYQTEIRHGFGVVLEETTGLDATRVHVPLVRVVLVTHAIRGLVKKLQISGAPC